MAHFSPVQVATRAGVVACLNFHGEFLSEGKQMIQNEGRMSYKSSPLFESLPPVSGRSYSNFHSDKRIVEVV